MKKVIVILAIMIAFVGAVFAADGDQLLIQCTIQPVPPIYAMYGSLTAYPTVSNNTYTGSLATNPVASTSTLTGGNIAEQDGGINVYVTVFQTNNSTFKKPAGVEVKVKASDLALVTGQSNNQNTYSTDYKVTPTVAGSAAGQTTATVNFDNTTAPAALDNGVVGVKFLPKYLTGVKVNANTIGTVLFNWAKTDTLPPGDYEATITLEYSTT